MSERQRRHRRKLEIAREVGAVRWAWVPLTDEQLARVVFVSGFSLDALLRMDDVELGRVISDELVQEKLGDMSRHADEAGGSLLDRMRAVGAGDGCSSGDYLRSAKEAGEATAILQNQQGRNWLTGDRDEEEGMTDENERSEGEGLSVRVNDLEAAV